MCALIEKSIFVGDGVVFFNFLRLDFLFIGVVLEQIHFDGVFNAFIRIYLI